MEEKKEEKLEELEKGEKIEAGAGEKVAECEKCGKTYKVTGVSLEGNICPECLHKMFGNKSQSNTEEERQKHVERFWKKK